MEGSIQAQVDSVLKRALALSDAARERFLDETCSRDTNLRAIVDRMLDACEADEPLLAPGAGASGPLWQELARDYAAHQTPEAGDRIGAYRIVQTLGRGGMATVYLAERADGEFEQTVAIKVLDASRQSDGLAVRFAQERQILATLEHPNIARLIDGGTTPTGQAYDVMEYIDGEPIDAHCDRRRLTIEQRIELFGHVIDAVQYAHGHLIVHRDIKPSNILVTHDGQPKLLDFGIAKLLDDGMPNVAPETRDAVHPMTPEYASPEQIRGERPTTASDVYQLGYLLYRLLTGQAPYECDRKNVADIIRVICDVEAIRPSQNVANRSVAADDNADARVTSSDARSTTIESLKRKLTGDVDNILLKALEKKPDDRYPSALHLRDDLRRHLEGLPVTARPPTVAYRISKFVSRHRAGVAAVALVLLAVVTGVAATTWQARETAREAHRAEAVLEFLVGLFESVDPNLTLGAEVTAKELLDRGAASLDERLSDVPTMRAEILGVVARMYIDLGLYKDARPLLENARSALAGTGGGEERGYAQSSDDLATVLYEQGEYEQAEIVAREALAVRRQNASALSGDLSTSVGNLASILSQQARFDESDSLYLEAIDIDRRSGSEQMLASHLSDFSASLHRATRFDDARRVGEESLQLQRKLHGPEHTLIATSLLNLGSAYQSLADADTAERLMLESLAMRQKLLGERHPHVAMAYHELGNLLTNAGRLDEAEHAHVSALSIQREALGEAHPDVGNSLNSVGIVVYFNGRYAEAAEMFEQVLPIWREAYGEQHPHVFSVLNNLGAARREAGNLEGAEIVLRETLKLRREMYGDVHREVAQSLNNLALLLAKRGANEEAESLVRQAVKTWKQTMGADHRDVGDGLATLGIFLADQYRCAEAEAPLRESLAIRTQVLDAEAPLLASSRMYLGECLIRLDRRAEAESHLALAVPVLLDHWGEDSEMTLRAQNALSEAQRQR